MSKLVCGKDEKKEGILSKGGLFQTDKFKEHILSCPDCKRFADAVIKLLGDALRERGGFYVSKR